MKELYRIIVCLILALCLFAVPAFAEEDLEEDWEYEGDSGVIAPDVTLASNPSTGYHWSFVCDEPDVVHVAENGFVSDDEELLGAPGKETFRLFGDEPGFATVTFSYARAQEEPLYTMTCQIIVMDDLEVVIDQMSFDMN